MKNELTIFWRRRIGFVFQSYNLVPILNVYENIVLPVELDGKKADKDFINEDALDKDEVVINGVPTDDRITREI